MKNLKALLLASAQLGALELSFQTIDRPGWTHTFVRGIENGRVVGFSVTTYEQFFSEIGLPFTWEDGLFLPIPVENIVLPPGSTISSPPVATPNDLDGGIVYGYDYYAAGRNYQVGPRSFSTDLATGLTDNGLVENFNRSGRIYGADKGVLVGAKWDFTAFWGWSGLIIKNGQLLEDLKPSPFGDTFFYAIDGDIVLGVHGNTSIVYDLSTGQFSEFGYPFIPQAKDGDYIVGTTAPEDGRAAVLGPDGLHFFNYPGAVGTAAYGVSGNQISGTYRDAAGYNHGFIATILDPDISGVIDETDTRITGSRSLNFLGGTLRPSAAGALVESDVVIRSGSTGTLDAVSGAIRLASGASVSILGSKLIIKGSGANEVTIDCAVSGAGVIQVNSGVLRISGVNTSGGLSALGGVTVIENPASLTASGNLIDGGTVVLASGTSEVRNFTQEFTLKGAGSAGQGALVLGTSNATKGIKLSGDLSMVGDTTLTFASLQTGVTSELSSAISSSVAGSRLTLSVLGEAVLTSTISSNVSQLTKQGAATLTLGQGFSYEGLLLVDAGLLDVSRTDLGVAAQLKVTDGQVRILPGASPTQQVSANVVLADRADLAVTQLTYGDGVQTLGVTQSGTLRLEGGNGSVRVNGGVGSLVTFSGDILADAPASLNIQIESSNTARFEGASDEVVTVLKTGSGSVELASGLLGKSFEGSFVSDGGQVDVLSGNSLPVGGLAVYGGSLSLKPSALEYDADIFLGSPAGNRLVIEAAPGSLSLQSNVIWGGSGVVEVLAGNHTFSGIHSSLTGSVDLDLNVATDSQVRLAGEFHSNVRLGKSGGGTLLLDSNPGMVAYAGQLKTSQGNVVVQTPGSMPLGGIRIEGGALELKGGLAGYSSPIDIAAGSTTTIKLSGRSEAGQIRGVALASDISLSGDLLIDAYDTGHAVSGALNGGMNSAEVRLNSGARLTLDSTWTADKVTLSGSGTFSIGSTGSINSDVVLAASEVASNGLIQGNIEVAAGTKLSGSGFYRGFVISRGTVGPGNSPGVITVDGTFTAATASNIEMEVFGLAGAGLPFGHDQIKVTGTPGTMVIQPGVSMSLIKGTGFEPARGNTFKLFDVVGGIAGTFGNVTSGFDQWVLFDYKTGNLYGTALSPSENLSKYDSANGAVVWDAGVSVVTNSEINGYVGVIDGSSTVGQAVLSILTGAPIFGGSLTPDVYLSLSQLGPNSADTVFRSILGRLEDRRFAWRPVPGGMPDGWFVDYGNHDVNNDSGVLRDFQVASYSAGYVNSLTDASTIVVALARSEFDGHASHAKVGGAGGSVILAWSQMLDSQRRDLALDVGLAYSKDSLDVSRDTFLGQYSATANSSTLSIFGRLTAAIGLADDLSATPYIGIRHAYVAQDGVTEQAGPNAVSIDAISHGSTRFEAGASLNKVVVMDRGDLRFSLGMEFSSEIGDTSESSAYGILGKTYTMSADVTPSTMFAITPAITLSTSSGTTYSMSVPVKTGDGYNSVTIQIGFSNKF